jgi:hypothetical protein
VKGGGRVTDDLTYYYLSESKRYVAGPTVELGLPHQFSLEFDALYRRHGYRLEDDDSGLAITFTRERANSWDFPILVKRHWTLARQHFFVGAGLSFQHISGYQDVLFTDTNLNTGQKSFFRYQFPTNWDVSRGFATSAGFRIGKGRIQFSPEFRYTRWISPVAVEVDGSHGIHFESTRNQIDLILGLGWKVR